MMKNKFDEISWIEIDNKINGRKISKESIEKLHSWSCNHPQVVNLPQTNHHFNIKYNTTVEFIKTQAFLIHIPIRKLHSYLIKPPPEGDFSGARSESGEVII